MPRSQPRRPARHTGIAVVRSQRRRPPSGARRRRRRDRSSPTGLRRRPAGRRVMEAPEEARTPTLPRRRGREGPAPQAREGGGDPAAAVPAPRSEERRVGTRGTPRGARKLVGWWGWSRSPARPRRAAGPAAGAAAARGAPPAAPRGGGGGGGPGRAPPPPPPPGGGGGGPPRGGGGGGGAIRPQPCPP